MNQGRIWGYLAALSFACGAFANADQPAAIPGEYVVKLKPAIATMNRVSMERVLGAKIVESVNRDERIILVQRPIGEITASAVATLNANPMVEIAEPNYIYRIVGSPDPAAVPALPNDTEISRLWGLVNNGQRTEGDAGAIVGKSGIDIGAQAAWGVTTGSRDIIVGVIDTGVNYNLPDLAPNIYRNEAEANGQAGVDDDNNGCVDDIYGCDFAGKDGDPMDVYGHGTHVAGTIGAVGNNSLGIVGVAWNVKILPIRFLGDNGGGSLADAIKSIDYATAMKVHMTNNSWGGGGFSQLLLESIQRAKDAGILFVAAAGNSSNDNDKRPEYPASYQVDNVISVAAIDASGQLADFSNRGRNSVHLAAPGVNILSYTMRGLESWSGTSMASPHVAGVAALLMTQDQTQSYTVIRQRLLNSARPMATLRNRVATGLVNAYYALTNTVAPADPDDPFTWQKLDQAVSTDHPYAHKLNQEWTLTVPGAQRIAVHFSRFETEAGYDKVQIKKKDGTVVATLSGNLGEAYSPVVEGDTLIMSFTSDDSVNAYGFDVSGIAYQ